MTAHPEAQVLLEAEGKAPIENAKTADVRGVVPKLCCYGPSSYASFTDAHAMSSDRVARALKSYGYQGVKNA